jgi:choline dehydrogenase
MMPSPIPHRPLLKAYDVIIIGSGSGGAPVARRLIDKTDATVLLIEAGSAEFDAPEISDPTQWVPLGRSRHDWLYDYAPTDRVAGRTIGIPRGKVLGGSSSTNAMMWYRGHPSDYDAWVAAGCDGWSFADCLPYFKRAEDWEGGETEYRGAGGPLRIEASKALHPVAQAMIDGAEELGIPRIADPNGETNEGAAPANFNIANGKRWSSATGYLAPVFGNPRLTILCNSQAIGLIIENSAIVGVRHLIGGKPVETRATTQVVLAAGAIDTPRLLTLSGIGDPMELASLGIETRHALPGVGKNLQDHPLVQAVVCRSKQPMGAPRDNGGGSMINWKSRSDLAQPDVHAFPVQGNSAEPSIRARYSPSGELFSIGAGLMQSRSVGHVKILSSDPFGPLDIQPNFLAEPSDLDALMVAAETMMDLAETRAFSDLFAGLAAPTRRLSKVEMIDFIRQGCSTFFHPVGTAKMGKDEMAVVDARLRLRGIDGLTIADASIIPIIPTCNTHAPVTMIGERAADFLIGAA